MFSTRARRGLAACVAAAALTLVSGCGGSGGSAGQSGAGAGSSSANGSGGPSASASSGGTAGTTTDLTGSNFGKALVAAQRKAGSFTFTLTSRTAGQKTTANGAGEFAGSGPAEVRTSMKVAGEPMQFISAGGYYYMKSPILHTAKPWLKVDPHAKSGIGALVGRFGGGNPSTSLDALYGASKVHKVGAGSAGTTHYRVVVPRSALVDAMHYPKQVVSLLPQHIVYDVWVDGHNLVHKMRMSMHIRGQVSRTVITMGDYGKKVAVKPPPADQITTKSPMG